MTSNDLPAVISTLGRVTRDLEPEQAVVSVSVLSEHKDRKLAVDLLRQRRESVQSLIASADDAIARVDGGAVEVNAVIKNGARDRLQGFAGRSTFQVTFTDFDRIEPFVAQLLVKDFTAIEGPAWSLGYDSEARRALYVDALTDARRRADDYAAALGLRVTAVASVDETGAESTDAGSTPRRKAVSLGRETPNDNPIELDFTPARQTVTAEITVRFTAAPAELTEARE